jgi:hypothetical protein
VAPISVSVPHVKIVVPDTGHHEVRLLDEVERVDADGRVRQSNGDRLRKAAAGWIVTTSIRSRDAWPRARPAAHGRGVTAVDEHLVPKVILKGRCVC